MTRLNQLLEARKKEIEENPIGDLMEEVRQNHKDVISNVKSIAAFKGDREATLAAIKSLETEKVRALMEIDDAQARLEKMAKDAILRADNKITQALEKIKVPQKDDVGKKEGAEAIRAFNTKISGLQNNMLDMNDTMLRILGALQSPKKIEFDDDGMPIGVSING